MRWMTSGLIKGAYGEPTSMSRLDKSDFAADVLDVHVFLQDLSCDGTFQLEERWITGR